MQNILGGELMAEEINDFTIDDLINDEVFSRMAGTEDPYRRKVLEKQYYDLARKVGQLRNCREMYTAYKLSVASIGQIGNASAKTNFPDGRPDLVLPQDKWITTKDGIFKLKRNAASDDYIRECICATPVLPTGILKNADTGMEKVQLSYYDKGRWNDTVCDREVLASNNKIVSLSSLGISVRTETASKFAEFMADCIDNNRSELNWSTSVSHLGWHGSEFVPYTDGVVFDGEREFKTIYDAVCTGGDFEEWKKYVRELRKNIYIRLMMGAAFASPLLSRIGALPFVLHLWGGTGAGKTVGLMVAASIWGNPALGKLVKSMNSTQNAAAASAAVLHDIPFAGDELQTIKENGGNYDKLIMTLCEGIERGRMKYEKVNETRSWNCAFLFTGEEPITHTTSGGGAKNRVIEIECKGKVVENGRETAEFVRNNYGFAGREFIRYINDNADELERLYGCFVKGLEEIDCTDKQRLSMAAILLGDTAGRMALFPDEAPLSADNVRPFLKTEAEVDASERAYAVMNDVFIENSYRFGREHPVNGVDVQPPEHLPKGDGYNGTWGWFEDGGRIAIIKSVLVQELDKHGFSFEAIKAKWTEKGYLIKNKQGKMMHQTKRKGIAINYILLQLYKTEEEQHT